MIKNIVAALLLVLAVGTAIISLDKQPEPLPEESESAKLLGSHRYGFIRENLYLVDDRRATQANKDFAGENTRTLEASYWYPVNDQGEVPEGRHPLVVYSHGFYNPKRANGCYVLILRLVQFC